MTTSAVQTFTIKTVYVDMKDAIVDVQHYEDGQLALEAIAPSTDPLDGPYAFEMLTTNLIGYGVLAAPGHVWVKDFDLYIGLPDALMLAGVADVVETRTFPFGRYAYMQVLIEHGAIAE